jgi:ribokinase
VKAAVVGHVEWVEFADVDHVPAAGEIVHASGSFATAAGGGGAAAVELARLAGGATFFTALGDDPAGHAARAELEARGVDVRAHHRDRQPRAFVHLTPAGERTITVLGGRHVPSAADDLGWEDLAACDAVFFTGGDAGALAAARAAPLLVATPRGGDVLRGVVLDVVVASAGDPGERVDGLDAVLTVLTEGERGGRWATQVGEAGRWEAAPLPGPPIDAYGCGDAFAAALTFALGRGDALGEALAVAATSGAAARCRRGPYG